MKAARIGTLLARPHGLVAVAAALLPTIGAAQATWRVRGPEFVRVVAGAGSAHRLVGDPGVAVTLPAGEFAVHFPAAALGKPGSLSVRANDGDLVAVTCAASEPAKQREVDVAAAGTWDAAAGVRTVADSNERSCRVTARLRGGTDTAGITARWTDAKTNYQFVWDRQAGEFRLELRMGDRRLLGQCAAPQGDDGEHELALQVDGFRLTASFDDVVVLQVLDGTLLDGRVGLVGDGPWRHFAIAAPAAPAPSAVLVQGKGHALYRAFATVSPGHMTVMELAIDRPGPALPLGLDGDELQLLGAAVGPRVLRGDWRMSIGLRAIGEVGRDGQFTAEIRWPDVAGLVGQGVLVRAALVAANGEAVAGWSPAVDLRLRRL